METDNFLFDKEKHLYTINGRIISSVTQELKEMGFYNFDNVPAETLEIARNFGEAVHLACYLHNIKRLNIDTLDEKITPYLECWKSFIADYKFSIEQSEVSLYSHKYGFAGTLDVYGKNDEGTISIIDIKTSHSYHPVTDYQLAAYAILLGEHLGIRNRDIQLYCVKLTDKFPCVIKTYDKSDIDAFLHIHYAYMAKKKKLLV